MLTLDEQMARPAFEYRRDGGPLMRIYANGRVDVLDAPENCPAGFLINRISILSHMAYEEGLRDGKAVPATVADCQNTSVGTPMKQPLMSKRKPRKGGKKPGY